MSLSKEERVRESREHSDGPSCGSIHKSIKHLSVLMTFQSDFFLYISMLSFMYCFGLEKLIFFPEGSDSGMDAH